MDPHPRPDAAVTLERNLRASLVLLLQFQRLGLRHLVLAPGSRSAPLAVAAGLLEARGLLRLHPTLDERSGAFLALGIARAQGVPTAVVTTSGSAVANLLPAAVEADHGCLPLLLLTADRPARLKGCGANQAVNQEDFLLASCRWSCQAAVDGIASLDPEVVRGLARRAWAESLQSPPGAVHLNLAYEEPLHADGALVERLELLLDGLAATDQEFPPPFGLTETPQKRGGRRLDPGQPGIIVAGPWRGHPQAWQAYRASLLRWQRATGWPLLADPLSCLRGDPELDLIGGYDLLLESGSVPAPPQVLRLGPLPASRRLQVWLAQLQADQVLVSEGDGRPMDPLQRVVVQDSGGLVAWVQAQGLPRPAAAQAKHDQDVAPATRALGAAWRWADDLVQRELMAWCDRQDCLSEPLLAHHLSRVLPAGVPVMLANSSPIRDWESFASGLAPGRPFAGFRGASGIDGTLSQACGLALSWGEVVLVSGDLALLHDSNGWLWQRELARSGARLTVVLLDNGGGGIFEQLPIRPRPAAAFDFERLFAMGQSVDPLALAAAHGVPGRQVAALADLAPALAWARSQPLAVLRLITDRQADQQRRQALRGLVTERLQAAA